jgi:hypothetical protein
MANTQRDGMDGRADAGCGPARGDGAARGCRPGAVAGGRRPASDGRSLQRPRLFGPRFWLLLLGLLTSVLGELPRIKRGDPRAGRSRADRIEFLDRVSTQSDQIELAILWQAAVEGARPCVRPGTGPGLSCWFVVEPPAGIEPATPSLPFVLSRSYIEVAQVKVTRVTLSDR